MRRKSEHGCEPQRIWCAWIVALACIAMAGLAPAVTVAQTRPGDTAVDDADEADEADAFPATAPAVVVDEVTQEDLDGAQANIDRAQATLDEAKRRKNPTGRRKGWRRSTAGQ